MDDFPANSKKVQATAPPQEKPQLKPVTSAKTDGRKKRRLGRQFKDTFIAGNPRDAAAHAIGEIVVPAIRDMFHDALQGGLDRLFYGERANKSKAPSWMQTGMGNVNYGQYSQPASKPKSASQPRSISRQARARHSLGEIVIPTRPEAEEVLDQLFEILSRDGVVTVADLFALTDIRIEHTDMKWGWTSLRGAKSMRLRQGGFLLDLPDPEPLA